jgi:putative heme-binding domain-containing protein
VAVLGFGVHRERSGCGWESLLRLVLVVLVRVAMCISPAGEARAAEASGGSEDARTAIAVEALSRLKGVDLEANPALKAAVTNILAQIRGKPQFVELVRQFRIKDQEEALLEYAVANPASPGGADAVRLILENRREDLLKQRLEGGDPVAATRLAEALGNAADSRAVPLLESVVLEASRAAVARREAVKALAKTQEGAAALLRMGKEDKLPGDVRLVASMELNLVPWSAIKREAAQVLPLPQGQNAEPLPPVAELVRMKGDAKRGQEVYWRETVGCGKCHQVNGKGIDFGPNLSEIGTKLAREAIYEAILDPSAGISFGYEPFAVELKNGEEAFGLVVSETADELAVKAQSGIVTRYKKDDIAAKQQQKISIMPAGLQMTMTKGELVDLVEFLASLKKVGG